MFKEINQWIDHTNHVFKDERQACDRFGTAFAGYFPRSFLEQAFYVVVDILPKPDFPALRQAGLGEMIDMSANAVTYKNVYYILPSAVSVKRLHFHELVHVAQWQQLGAINFIARYVAEIQTHGYSEAPLETMAYGLDEHFSEGGEKFDIPAYVTQQLEGGK